MAQINTRPLGRHHAVLCRSKPAILHDAPLVLPCTDHRRLRYDDLQGLRFASRACPAAGHTIPNVSYHSISLEP